MFHVGDEVFAVKGAARGETGIVLEYKDVDYIRDPMFVPVKFPSRARRVLKHINNIRSADLQMDEGL